MPSIAAPQWARLLGTLTVLVFMCSALHPSCWHHAALQYFNVRAYYFSDAELEHLRAPGVHESCHTHGQKKNFFFVVTLRKTDTPLVVDMSARSPRSPRRRGPCRNIRTEAGCHSPGCNVWQGSFCRAVPGARRADQALKCDAHKSAKACRNDPSGACSYVEGFCRGAPGSRKYGLRPRGGALVAASPRRRRAT